MNSFCFPVKNIHIYIDLYNLSQKQFIFICPIENCQMPNINFIDSVSVDFE